MNVLAVLMWHHLLVRKKRFILTTLELIAPIIVYLVAFCGRTGFVQQRAQPSSGSDLHLNSHTTGPLRLGNTKPISLVFYSPSTKLTDALMDAVGEKLGLSSIDFVTGVKPSGYYALDDNISSSQVTQLLKGMDDSSAIVLFSNMDGVFYPPKLNYTIKINENAIRPISRSLDDDSEPEKFFDTISEHFMHLQWAIDTSYIKLRTGKNVDRELYLQLDGVPISSPSDRALNIIEKCATYAPIIPYVFFVHRVMQYKETGLEELIEIAGVTPFMFRLSHFLNMIPGCLLFSVFSSVLLKVSSNPLLPSSTGVILFFALTLHFTLMMVVAFIFSYVSNDSRHAILIAVPSYLFLVCIEHLLSFVFEQIEYVTPVLLYVIALIFPVVAHREFWRNVNYFEEMDEGVTFETWFENNLYFSPAYAIFLMLLQTIIYSFLAWYIVTLRARKYGVAKTLLMISFVFHWDFVCYICCVKDTPVMEVDEPFVQNHRYFEPAPHDTDVGIKIVNISKLYGKKKVLTNVTLNLYKGEITVLLGHNGAGKTTLMTIVAGIIKMTSGSVYVNGVNLSIDPERCRRDLALCPQHNVGVPYFTVHQQVMFFALLSGQQYKQAESSSKQLLEQVGLGSKLDNFEMHLSGGMKRRLQLACALSGRAPVLILDEPTSGVDVETRREIWDLLLALRGQHTVLLSTHFMEEADMLGDRVATLHNGVLRCYASPMFLKKSFGTGYRLSLTTNGTPNVEEIYQVITSVVPLAVLREKGYNSVSFTLPSEDNNKFAELFSALESKRSELNIEGIGVGVSTIQDVFSRICRDVAPETVDTDIPEPTYVTTKGAIYYLETICFLGLRQSVYVFRNMILGLISNIVLMTAVTVITRKLGQSKQDMRQKESLNLGLYRGQTDTRVVYQVPEHQNFRSWGPKVNDVVFKVTQDNITSNNLNATLIFSKSNKYISGIELNATHAKVIYTSAVRHAGPVALNMLSNILAEAATPPSSIATYNEPLQEPKKINRQPLEREAIYFWTTLVVIALCIQLSNASTVVLKDRLTGIRHIHLMAGCPPALHWLVTLAAQTFPFIILFMVPVMLLTLIDPLETITNPLFVGTLFLIMLIGATAWLAMAYFLHFSTNSEPILIVTLNLLIIIGVVIAAVIRTWEEKAKTALPRSVFLLANLLPSYTMTIGLMYAARLATKNAKCNMNGCANKGKDPYCYLCFEDPRTPLIRIIVMFFQTIVYMILVILAEYGLFAKLWDKLVNLKYKPPTSTCRDPMVLAEKEYVDNTIVKPTGEIPDAMLVSDVHKNYFRCRSPCTPFQAVKGVSFSVKKGECFGLLGVNGAGKSTTFGLISAEKALTGGKCFADSQHLKCNKMPYIQSLSYCTQNLEMDELSTGRQNLKLLLMLRGMRKEDIETEVNAWIAVAGLEPIADQQVKKYSTGCSRRLAVVSALAMGAAVTLLDEPTAGVDVAARPRLWLAVRKGLRNQRAVVLASHSLDEMEALCERMGILVRGEVVALGSAPALRAAHATGHALHFKLHPAPAHADTYETDGTIENLKRAIQDEFKCTLTEEHKTMLHYHVGESVPYSELFGALEDLKQTFPELIEDYSVSETTLEEAFHFYAHQNEKTAI